MQVRVLGDLEVEVAGRTADLGGPKPRALLSLLVVAGGRPVPVEHLIDQMWGEHPPARVEASLQSYVARLRRVLEPDRAAGDPARILRTHAAGYSLRVDAADVDAHRFTALLGESRTCFPDRAVDLLVEALALWRGVPYAGLDCPTLRAEATRLDELRLDATARLWELRMARGEHVEAVAGLEQLVRLHPLQERWWSLLALALYRASRQADALAAVQRARRLLADELGVDPGPELRRVEEQVLRHDPALLAAPPSRAPDLPPAASPGAAGTAGTGLHGRQQALLLADGAVAAARAGRGRVVLVTGEPGIGKTRLCEAIAARATATGLRVGRGAWDAEGGPPLEGWTRSLTQVLGHAPSLGLPTEVEDAGSATLRQADAVLAALRAGPPTLLVLDDLHWADQESLRLLRRVAGGVVDLPVVLVLTTRVAPAEVGVPLEDALATLARLDPLRIELAGLGPEDVAAWASEQSGRDVDAAVASELVRRTDGNPFYLTELVRFLVREGALANPDAGAWRTVPGGVRDVVRQRSRQLPDDAAAVLALASVVGRSFDLDVLAVVSGDATAVAEAVEASQVLGLVDEETPGRFRFTHALVRDAVYESVPAARRGRMHAAVAAALEDARAGRVAQHAAELAEHYRLAGPAHARSAWVLARTAAASASVGSAYDEALRLLTFAVDLQDLDPTVDPVEREEVLVARSRALIRVSRPVEAWEPAQEASRLALARGDRDAAAAALLTVTEGMLWGWRPHPAYDDDAIALWRQVRHLFPADDPEHTTTRALLTAALSAELLHRPGSASDSTALSDEAVAAVRRLEGRGPRELQVLRVAQVGLLRPSLLHHRMPLADEVVELAARVGQPHDLSGALTSRAQDRGELGRLDGALSDVVRAREVAERHHLGQNLAVTGWCLSVRRMMDGHLAEAERLVRENEAFQATLAVSGYGIGLCQLTLLRDLQGRMVEMEPALRKLRAHHPGLRELHALAMVRAGRLDELRVLLGEWREQPELLEDYLWLFLQSIRAEVWSALGDVAAARDLLVALTPYADRLALSVPVGFHGSVHLALGRLAATAGEPGVARDHLVAARRVHAGLGLASWVERTEAELARLPR